MKKILGFIICIMLITATGLSIAESIPTGTIKNNNAYCLITQEKKSKINWEENLDIPDKFIKDLIHQINETMYLGYLENITFFGPRWTGTNVSENVSEYIYNEFLNMSLEVRFHEWKNDFEQFKDRNVEATLNGTNQTSDEIYIICAHHDSSINSPGADDDGSGVAAVLSAAKILSQYQFNHTIKFVTFSGEEPSIGLMGSNAYANEAFENGDNIVSVLNVDMIGFATNSENGKKIIICDGPYYQWITDFSINIGEIYYDYIHLDNIIQTDDYLGDEESFLQLGYTAIGYHEYEDNPYYHTSYDNISNMNITYALKGTRLVLATMGKLAESTVIGDPPEVPILSGSDLGIKGQYINFTVITTDPDDDDIHYLFDWGDGSFSDWLGPYKSGEYVEVTHAWDNIGVYNVRVKAIDENYRESNWSDTHTINIVHIPMLEIKKISGGLFMVKADIKNIGGLEATDVNWSITLDGGAFIGKKTEGTGLSILSGETEAITSKIIFGFGPTAITIDAWIPESSDKREISGFVLLFYVRVNPGG